MKHLLFAITAAALCSAFADEKKSETELAEQKAPILWGFGNYGIYTGYQLYGSIVNTEPTLQGYFEVNGNLPFQVGAMDDLGYLGVGLWNNSDLTGKRTASYRRALNEFDFNIHWGKTFWFDDEKTWGLTYRSSVVWYFYPHTGGKRDGLICFLEGGSRGTRTTFDWDHYFELANPYLIPYINIVHEYEQSHGNLLQFGVKKPFQITDQLSVCPFIEAVWRNRNYGWCFSNYGTQAFPYDSNFDNKIEAGIATIKLELDATYMFNDWIGIFAKVAYCQNVDPNLRHEANEIGSPRCPWGGEAYGRWNEFCWGGAGVCVSF